MLPWEHLAVAYCCYSLLHRAITGRPPDGRAAVAIAVGALLPDLIDKPLAWEVGVLPGGRSLGHSLLFAVPAIALVWAALGRVAGSAFGVAYCTHLATDVVYPVLFGREPVVGFLLYPLWEAPPSDAAGFLLRTEEIAADLRAFLGTPRGRRYFLFELALLAFATLLWLLDGAPGWRGWRVALPGDRTGDR